MKLLLSCTFCVLYAIVIENYYNKRHKTHKKVAKSKLVTVNHYIMTAVVFTFLKKDNNGAKKEHELLSKLYPFMIPERDLKSLLSQLKKVNAVEIHHKGPLKGTKRILTGGIPLVCHFIS